MTKKTHSLGISSLSWSQGITAYETAVLEADVEEESTEPDLPVNREVLRDVVSFYTRGKNQISHDWEVPVEATLKDMGYSFEDF